MKKGKPIIVRIRCLKKKLNILPKLGMNIMEGREPPSMAGTETYQKSLWGEEAQLN